MAKKEEESVQSINLDNKLEKIKQKLTRVIEDRIQVSVNQALQKIEKKLSRYCFRTRHSIIKWDEARESQARLLIAAINQTLECMGFLRIEGNHEMKIFWKQREVVRVLELFCIEPANCAIATTRKIWLRSLQTKNFVGDNG